MADHPTSPTDAAPPTKSDAPTPTPAPANGPGLMMVFGLGCLALAAWCAHDEFFRTQEWGKDGKTFNIWFNRGGMVVGVIGAIYCFIVAAARSKKAPAAAGSPKPPQPGA